MDISKLPLSERVSKIEIIRTINKLIDGYMHQIFMTVLTEEPEEKAEGMIVRADGVNWNPGSGEGLYEYRSGSWVLL